jgi:hypothetical protein
LSRDIDCFLRTYVPSRKMHSAVLEDTLDCPLVELGLLREAGDRRTFQFNRGPQAELPTGILLYATLDYWSQRAIQAETLSLHELAYHPGSPGRIFQIDEDSLAARFEEFDRWTDSAIRYGHTSGIKQLYRHGTVTLRSALRRTFGRPLPKRARVCHAK